MSELRPRGAHAAPSSVFSDTPFHAEPAPLGEMAGLGLGRRKLTVRAGDRPRAEGPGQRGREHSLEAPPTPSPGPGHRPVSKPSERGVGAQGPQSHRGESVIGHKSKHRRGTNSLFGRMSEHADSSPFLTQLHLPLPPKGRGRGRRRGRGERLHGGAAQHVRCRSRQRESVSTTRSPYTMYLINLSLYQSAIPKAACDTR